MSEVSTLSQIVKELGIPALFFLMMIYLSFKLIPDVVKAWREDHEHTKKYYTDRQKQYDDQMSIVIKVAEQGNQVIARSNEIISMNTEAIKQNTMIHDKVASALSRDLQALQALTEDLKVHDRRAEEINTGIQRLLDRVE